MAANMELVKRVREALGPHPALGERKMFGGHSFLLHGNYACGVLGDDLVVRVAKDDSDWALAQSGVRPMDFTGRPMRGWVYVAKDAIVGEADLRAWVDRGA